LNTLVEAGLGPEKDNPLVAEELRKYVSAVGPPSAMMTGMAFPGTLVLDREGRVTARFFEELYFDRITTSSVMAYLSDSSPPVEATRISTAHLDVVAFPSDASVATGNRFSLIFDVTPHRNMHVYAPGASSYRVVSVSVTPQPFVQPLQPLRYPQSDIYFFEPLNERVPVYQKPFRLVQDVLLEGTTAAQTALRGKDSLTIAARLDYQACDDKTCYNPTTVPVTFTLSLHSLVRERPQVR